MVADVETGIKLDLREFNAAVAQYAKATRKTFAQAGNRQLANLAIKAAAIAQQAKPAEVSRTMIAALRTAPWWPKLVAKILGGSSGQMSRSYQGQWARANSATLGQSRSGGVKRKLTQTEFLHAQEARKMSARLLAKRRRAVGFIRTFFLAAAREMRAAYKQAPAVESPQTKFGIKARVQPCTETRGGYFESSYQLKVRGSGTASRANVFLQRYLSAAVKPTIEDMREYARRELQKIADRHSARRAA
jgi:hypothetical protein